MVPSAAFPAAAPAAETSITEAVKDAWEEVYQALDHHVLLQQQQQQQQQQPPRSLTKAWLQSVLPAQALRVVLEAGLGSLVLEYVAEGLDQELVKVVRPAFWQHFQQQQQQQQFEHDDDEEQQCQRGSPEWVYTHMRAALTYASQALEERDGKLALLGQVLLLPHQARQERATLRTRLAAIVFNTAPEKEGKGGFLEEWWVIIFRTSLRAWHKAWREQRRGRGRGREGGEEEDMMSVEDEEEEDEEEEEMEEEGEGVGLVKQEEVEVAWRALRRLGWLPLVQSAITQVMKGETERYIERTCTGVYEVPRLGQVGAWKDAVLMPWLEGLMEGGGEDEGGREDEDGETSNVVVTTTKSRKGASSSSSFQEWRLRHAFSVYESFAGVRMVEMFDIIRDFPDSLPAVLELREALKMTQQHRQLAGLLRESMRSRLLHNGANTMQIIDVYIATIKVRTLFIYLFIYVCIHLFIYLFIYLCIYLCIYLFIYLFYLFIYSFIYVVYLFIYLFIYLFNCFVLFFIFVLFTIFVVGSCVVRRSITFIIIQQVHKTNSPLPPSTPSLP